MNRHARIQSAKCWIPTYTGKDIIRGYRKRFGVDKLAALIELQMCGAKITQEMIDQERERLAKEAARKAAKAERAQREAAEAEALRDWLDRFECRLPHAGQTFVAHSGRRSPFEPDDYDPFADC